VLSEIEIVEASGPLVTNIETKSECVPHLGADQARPPAHPARGLSAVNPEIRIPVRLDSRRRVLRSRPPVAARGRYGEALDAWESALALAPSNQLYDAHVRRLRQQLHALRDGRQGSKSQQ
jgi:hypothetical protein